MLLSLRAVAMLPDSTVAVLDTNNLDSLNVRHFEFLSLKYDFVPNSKAIGNSLRDFQLYDPAMRNGFQYFGLGNVGASYYQGWLEAPEYKGFTYWPMNTRLAYMYHSDNSGFYNSDKAYSRVNYIGGAEKENVSDVVLARNFGPYFNVGFQFSRINSEGFYVRQLNSYSNIAVFSKLYSKDQKYLLLVNGAFNGNTNQESGGLSADSLFESNTTNNRKLLPVNLQSAETRFRKRHAFVYQSYDISGDNRDTIIKDSIVNINRMKEGRVLRLAHTFEYNMYAFAYDDTDPLSGYYDNVYLDSSITADSTRYRIMSNTFSLIYFGKDTINKTQKKNSLALDFKWDEAKISQVLGDTLDTLSIQDGYTNLTAKLSWTYRGRVIDFTKVSGTYGVSGYNQGDMGVNALVGKQLGQFSLALKANYLSQTPAYMYTNFSSNHFRWANSFNRSTSQNFGLDINWQKAGLQLSADYTNISKLVYLDTAAMPMQATSGVNVLAASLGHYIELGVFSFQTRGIFQNVSGADLLRLPAVLVHETIAYEDKWFKKKLHIRMGFDIFYNTSFYANAYNPSLMQFHLQDEKKIGNYPYIDFFFTFRIKKFRAFLKMEHINSGFMGYTYYYTPSYPAKDRAFKFGISWAFLD